jgi:hypothetical protein
MISGELTERNFWSGKLSLGATLTRGNVDQTDISGFINIQRRTAWTRLTLEYSGAFSSINDETTVDNHRALANYDIYLTRRLYVRPARIVYFRDKFQNIDARITPSAGFGYDIIDNKDVEWSAGAGLGWEYTRFVDPAPGNPESTDSIALIAGTRFEWELTSKTDVGLEFDVTVPTKQFSAYNFRTKLFTEVELWGDFDLDVQLIWDRVNDPAPLADGSIPEKDDARLYVGIGWSF